jgi:hypothetical protein
MTPKVSRSGNLAVSKASLLSLEERRALRGIPPPAISNGLPAAAAVLPLPSPRPPPVVASRKRKLGLTNDTVPITFGEFL